jgi:beta-lactamase class C
VERLEQAIADAMDRGRVPGMVVAFARGDDGPHILARGTDAAGTPLAPDTLFPVASITKLATALVTLRLAEAGALHLDDLLRDHLPQAAAAQDGVTIRSLLCHTAGLPADIAPDAAPYARGLDWPALAAALAATPLERPPWTRVVYSNAGFGLLGVVAEHLTGQAFREVLSEDVLQPLGVEGYFGVEPPRRAARIADVRGSRARDPALEPHNSPFYRSLGLPWAGLVTNAAGALRIVRAYAGRPEDYLRPETRAEATRSNTRGLPGGAQPPLQWDPCPWGLGVEVRGEKQPHWTPPAAGPDSFGHSGGSGCLAWYAPSHDVAWAILGARTADSGWLLRRAPAIGEVLLEMRRSEF